MLSSEVASQLRTAISQRWTRPEHADGALVAALAIAAREARDRSLRPEELLIALKAIEEDVAVASKVANSEERDRFRFWLVGACMRAFFSDDATDDG